MKGNPTKLQHPEMQCFGPNVRLLSRKSTAGPYDVASYEISKFSAPKQMFLFAIIKIKDKRCPLCILEGNPNWQEDVGVIICICAYSLVLTSNQAFSRLTFCNLEGQSPCTNYSCMGYVSWMDYTPGKLTWLAGKKNRLKMISPINDGDVPWFSIQPS